MGEIPGSEIKPGYVIRHFFQSDFGLHKIEGLVDSVSLEKTAANVEYVSVTLVEAIGSDVSRVIPGAYLYGDGGLRHQDYNFPIMPNVKVLLLAREMTVQPFAEILADALPIGSFWKWSPSDGSHSATVEVTRYLESPDGPWIYFKDQANNPWTLEPEAFHAQCRFLAFREYKVEAAP